MDGSRDSTEPHTRINRVTISRDRKYVSLCTTVGFSLYSAASFKCVLDLRTEPDSVLDADIASPTSLICLQVGEHKFQLWNASAAKQFSPTVVTEDLIKALRVNTKRVLVLTPRKLLVFGLRNLEFLFVFERGEAVPLVSQPLISITDHGLCAFTIADGGVQVIDTLTLARFSPIKAHTSHISAIELSETLLITASVKGTIVRVFQVPSMDLVGLFRRGRNETPIRSLQLSHLSLDEGVFLTVTGDSDTCHIFQIPNELTVQKSPTLLTSVLSFFPKHYKDALEATRDFAQIRLRREAISGTLRYVAAIRGKSESRGECIVVSEETGYVFVYDFNLAKGGECRLRYEDALFSGLFEKETENVETKIIQRDERVPSDTVATASTAEDSGAALEGKRKTRKKKTSKKKSTEDNFEGDSDFTLAT